MAGWAAVGTERVLFQIRCVRAEGLRPGSRRQLIDQTVRVGRQPQQDVLQIDERRHIDQFAALHEGVQERGSAGPLEAARKQPILATDRDEAELVLGTGMPPAGLCRVTRLEGRITPIWTHLTAADAA